jgi:hypothetical protein
MSNVKAQSSNEIQSSNGKRTKLLFVIKAFDIDLTFACLPVGRDFDI